MIEHILRSRSRREPMHALDRHLLPAVAIGHHSRRRRAQRRHRHARRHALDVEIAKDAPLRPLRQIQAAGMRRVRATIARHQRIGARRNNPHVLDRCGLQAIATRPRRGRHRHRAVAHIPARARARRARQPASARGINRSALDGPAHRAASRARPPRRRRARCVPAHVHIDRQIAHRRATHDLRAVGRRHQHILTGKSLQRRNRLAQSTDRFASPRQRLREAGSLRKHQRHPIRVCVIQRRLQRVCIVRRSIADRAKLLHIALMRLRTRRAQILHPHAVAVRESVGARVARRNQHRAGRTRRRHRRLQVRHRAHARRRHDAVHRRRRQCTRHIAARNRHRLRHGGINVMLVRGLHRLYRILAQVKRPGQRSSHGRKPAAGQPRHQIVHVALRHRLHRLRRRHHLRPHRADRGLRRRRYHPVLRARRPVAQRVHRRIEQPRRRRPRIRRQIHAHESIRADRRRRVPGHHRQPIGGRKCRPAHIKRARAHRSVRQIHRALHRHRRHRGHGMHHRQHHHKRPHRQR